jgi:hypothetical protein
MGAVVPQGELRAATQERQESKQVKQAGDHRAEILSSLLTHSSGTSPLASPDEGDVWPRIQQVWDQSKLESAGQHMEILEAAKDVTRRLSGRRLVRVARRAGRRFLRSLSVCGRRSPCEWLQSCCGPWRAVCNYIRPWDA